jgi:hypothetical protein
MPQFLIAQAKSGVIIGRAWMVFLMRAISDKASLETDARVARVEHETLGNWTLCSWHNGKGARREKRCCRYSTCMATARYMVVHTDSTLCSVKIHQFPIVGSVTPSVRTSPLNKH